MQSVEEKVAYIKKFILDLDEEDLEDLDNGNSIVIDALMSHARYNERQATENNFRDMTISEFVEAIVDEEPDTTDDIKIDFEELVLEQQEIEKVVGNYQTAYLKEIQSVDFHEKKEKLEFIIENELMDIDDLVKERRHQQNNIVKKSRRVCKEQQSVINHMKKFHLDLIQQSDYGLKSIYEKVDNTFKEFFNQQDILKINEIENELVSIESQFESSIKRLINKFDNNINQYNELKENSNFITSDKNTKFREKWMDSVNVKRFFTNRKNYFIEFNELAINFIIVIDDNQVLIDRLCDSYPGLFRNWKENVDDFYFITELDKGSVPIIEKFSNIEKDYYDDNPNDNRILIVPSILLVPNHYVDQNIIYFDFGKGFNYDYRYHIDRFSKYDKVKVFKSVNALYEIDLIKYFIKNRIIISGFFLK